MGNSANTGNAGEFLVLAELLSRGHHAGLAGRGNPTFDIITRYGNRYSSLRVKTSNSQSFQWTAKGDWEPLPGHDRNDSTDFVVLVAFKGNGPRGADMYVIPACVVVDTINNVNSHYHSFPKRNGEPRKRTKQRVLQLDGKDRPDNTSYDFARKWEQFREAWHLLEST